MIETLSEEKAGVVTITNDSFIYVTRNFTVQPGDQCYGADKRYYSMNKIKLVLKKKTLNFLLDKS